ncbi:alkyl sulfatase dimerization domain-containing protein [Streptomyces sp. NPDC059352]|uniref:alkyl sulfatase dimerization domain-containing protein n=1 Tax=Streptomyces sp. NPDC059352 TaxID=3346810 RepID=UPI0036825839
MKVPEELLAKPYLHPAYDEPEFVVRNLWRLWGGWYDRNPANLKPAPEAAVAAELADAADGALALAERAARLLEEGDLRLASHLAETAALGALTALFLRRERDADRLGVPETPPVGVPVAH